MKLFIKSVACFLAFSCFSLTHQKCVIANPSQIPHEQLNNQQLVSVVPDAETEKYTLRPVDSRPEFELHPGVDYASEFGVFLGGVATVEDYGFKKAPYRYRMQLDGGAASANDIRYKLHYSGDFRTLIKNTSLFVEAGTSGLDIIHFYGLGNEKYFNGSGLKEEDFEILNQITSLRASLSYPMDTIYKWSAGIDAKWVDLSLKPGSFNDLQRAEVPGINNDFAGSFTLGFHYDSRDSGDAIEQASRYAKSNPASQGSTTALSGMLIDVTGKYYPEFFGNQNAYGKISGEVRTYIPLVSSRYSRVVFRLGGEKIWGDYPFYESAFLGGSTSLRGYDKQRFAGDASLYAGSELRLFMGTFKLFAPIKYGPLFFAETGRVFVDGEDSDAWHTGAGGGLWFSLPESRYTATIAFGKGFDNGRLMNDYGIYVRTEFSF
ncbi:MAG: BamA/TamA family outer membrane protein [Chlorobiales bacterium]|nr:BamA/TamA family outer membrane protein [Chlorobiales bacterium]